VGEIKRRFAVLIAVVVVLTGIGATTASADVQIVGGDRVAIADHPWVVYLTDANGFQFCGGTLVAPTKVLTAAHCADGKRPSAVRVVVGREDKQTKEGVVSPVSGIWVHPDYAAADQGEDVAVLTLPQALSYRTLPLADGSDEVLYKAGRSALALGWGRTSEQGATSRYLLGATVPFVSDATCETAYPQLVPTEMVCAGFPEGGKDTCQGDSGGPLVAGGKLVGVTSWGEGCARKGKPGVYVRVATYWDLLTEQIDVT